MRFDTGCSCCAGDLDAYEEWLMRGVGVITHPLARRALARLRDPACEAHEFARGYHALGFILTYEAVRDLATPGGQAERLLIVSFEHADPREGLCGIAPYERWTDVATLRRDPTLDVSDCCVLLVASTLSPARSIVDTIDMVKRRRARIVRFACVLAASAGIEALRCAHPEVFINAVAVEDDLRADGEIANGFCRAGRDWLSAREAQ